MPRKAKKRNRVPSPEAKLPDEFAYLENEEIYDAVVLGGMAKAKRNLDIATANLKDMHVAYGSGFVSIVEMLDELCSRGVRVRLLHSGRPSGPFRESLERSQLLSRQSFTMKRCVRLHFKAVVIDARHVYLGSANMSGAGMGAKGQHRRNFEVGFLTDDAYLCDRISALFDRIWEGEFCPKCQRRKQCVQADMLDKSR